ncbi:Aste57867_17068 [Aphanomyces stellatus]|uniref:Aste57867_17068 protein n=1 Tax=Aphanomyces stellatus TaxID=120398 RepID=A0A485L712_9STRA|nr:hypothetical protein As57867_017010 [Aphanomyces stellatus]VFT93829.1 Aste57867_17068 [Aphanomyces stellatus]
MRPVSPAVKGQSPIEPNTFLLRTSLSHRSNRSKYTRSSKLGPSTKISRSSSPPPASVMDVAYEVLEVEPDKTYKGVKRADRILSSIALNPTTPTLYVGDASASLHAFTLDKGLRFHHQHKKVYHESAQTMDTWGACATIVDAKLTMLPLPLDATAAATTLDETKGITSLSAHEQARVLCCLVKQNLMVYDWSVQGRLQLRSSHDLSDRIHVAQTVLALGSSLAVVVFKKKTAFVNLDTGALTTLPVPDTTLFCVRVDGKHPSLDHLLVATKDHGLLLRWDAPRGVVVDGRLEWLHAPRTAIAHHPYILVSFADRVDAYNAASFQIAQSIPTKAAVGQLVSVSTLRGDDATRPMALLSAQPFNLTLLRMKPVVDQLKYFVLTTRYADAIGLCTLCPDECHIPPAELQDLHVKYALQLFTHRKYDAAVVQFLESGTSARHVISLFPEELLPRGYILPQAYHLPALTGDALATALVALVAYLEGYRARLPSNTPRDDLVLYDTVLLKAYVLTDAPALAAFCSSTNAADLAESELFLRAHSRWNPLLALYKVHTMHRKALELLEELDLASPGQYAAPTAQYLQTLADAPLVFEFSHRILSQSPELGLSIFTRRNHPAQKPDIDPAHVLNHLKSIDRVTHPEAELPNMLPLEDGRSIAIAYLSQVIYANEVDIASTLHDELVYLLLDAIDGQRQKRKDAFHPRVHLQKDRLGVLRKALLAFLQSPLAMYHPERLLSRTPPDMLEERAVLLANMGRHEEVLRLYVHDIRDAALAETYCNECYAHQITDASIYTLFLQTYLRPPSSTHPSGPSRGPVLRSPLLGGIGMHFVAAFMLRHADCIDVATALELLPPTLEASAVAAYLQRVLELKVEKKRNAQVQKQLLKIENLHVRGALLAAHGASVRVDLHSECTVCGRMLDRGPVLYFPDGALLHYACQSSLATT